MSNSARQIFHSGLYTTGDKVMLRNPGDYAGSFENPYGVLTVAAVHFFRLQGRPTYVLSEKDGPGVVPFHDDDLVAASPDPSDESK